MNEYTITVFVNHKIESYSLVARSLAQVNQYAIDLLDAGARNKTWVHVIIHNGFKTIRNVVTDGRYLDHDGMGSYKDYSIQTLA